MGLKEFKILFDTPYATYHPDQTVTGKVVLTIDGPKKIKGESYKTTIRTIFINKTPLFSLIT